MCYSKDYLASSDRVALAIVVFDPVDNVRYISQQYGRTPAVRDDHVVIGGAAETTFGTQWKG
jgi:hypothetical protein